MRQTSDKARSDVLATRAWELPRGWVVVGLALASWALLAMVAAGFGRLVGLLSGL